MTTPSICEGLTVLELGSGSIGAAFAGMLLADNGARVIKVEPPEGDRLRTDSPSGYLVWCRGKESLVLDLRTAEGAARLAELATAVDVVIDGLAPGRLAAWGVSPEELRAANPALVYCAVTAFGTTGEYARLKGYEGVVAAKAGLFMAGGGYTGRVARPGPLFANVPLGSIGAGHMAAAGVLAALIAREVTGRGQTVEATMVQGVTPLDYYLTMIWQRQLQAPPAAAMPADLVIQMPPAMPSTKDGRWLNVGSMLPHQREATLRALGLLWMHEDPRYMHAPMFPTQDDARSYLDLYQEAFADRTLAEWLEILEDEPDIPFEVALTTEEAMEHPQAIANGQIIVVDDPVHGKVEEIGPLAWFSRTPSTVRRSAPALDQHDGLPEARPATSPANGPAPAHPLEGITIVEFGYFYAMPFGVTMVGSYGARVVKIEDHNGDPMRSAFPGNAEVTAVKTMEGKESIALDVRTPEGRQVLHALLKSADAFVFGFRPSVAERLGLTYEAVREVNPSIVYLHAAGYGIEGPYSHRPIYAMQASAAGGAYGRQAGEWLDPALAIGASVAERERIAGWLQPLTDGDSNGALGVATALMLALYHRRRTGEGQFLVTTMTNSSAYAYADDFIRYAGKVPVPVPDREQYGLHALYRLYPTERGWVFVAAPTQAEWERLADALGRPGLASDPRFATAEARRAHDPDLVDALTAALAGETAGTWESAMTPLGLAVVEVFEGSMADFTNTDSFLREQGMVGEVEHPIFGTVLRHGVPVRFSETPGRLAPGCILGQHTDALLAELGYSAEEITRLKAGGVVLPEPLDLTAPQPG